MNSRRAIYPGSFDPVTNGHLDIIERGCKLFDEIVISILVNPEKQPFFTVEERREMLAQVAAIVGDLAAVGQQKVGALRGVHGTPAAEADEEIEEIAL